MKKLSLFSLAVLALAVSPAIMSAKPPTGTLPLLLTYNVTPNPDWQPGLSVFLYSDARRNPEINQEDIFWAEQFPGTYPRTAGQTFNVAIPNVRVGEKIIVQGYICAEGTTDCIPSDKDNPPTCSVEVHVLGNFRAKCQPMFTWTGGDANGNVSCRAECR